MNYSQNISKLIVLFLLNTLAYFVHAENDLKFNHLTVNDGLLHNNVTCVAQDSTGFIWIGTQRGLNRYDGYKIDSYQNNSDLYTSVYSNRIRSITIKENLIWIVTFQGIECFDISTKRYLKVISENKSWIKKNQLINSIYVDSKNRIWLNPYGEIRCASFLKNENDIVLKEINLNLKSYRSDIQNVRPEIIELDNGTLFLLLASKLFQIQTLKSNPEKIVFIPLTSPLDDVRFMAKDANSLWLFSQTKALGLKFTNGKIVQFDEINYSPRTVVGADFSSNYIWLSTNQGLLKVDKKPIQNRVEFQYHSTLDLSTVASDHQSGIFIDNQNNLWVSTWSGGLSYANIGKQKFELIKYKPNFGNKYLPSEFVFAIHEDNKGDIYVGTKFGGISKFNVKNRTFDYTINLLDKLKVNAVVPCIDTDDDWIYAAVTFQGSIIYRFNKVSQKIELVKSFVPYTVFSLGFDNHKQLWVGVLGYGLSCLKLENGKVVNSRLFSEHSHPSSKLSSNAVNYVFNDKQKNEVLISTDNGINRLMLNDKGEVSSIAYYFADINKSNSLSSNYVWPIDKENDSTYWVGTLGSGLNRITIGKRVQGVADYKAERFGVKEGAPSNDIESVLVDKFGNIWCGGRYLSQFNYKTKKFKTYYEEDGLQSYLFGTGTSCKSRSGMLFFGGLKGMNYFMPDTTSERKKFKIVFSRMFIDEALVGVGDTINGRVILNNDLQYVEKVKIPYPCNSLKIEFSSLIFSQNKSVEYRYKLDGYDKNWTYTNGLNSSAFYSKLPYNSYNFIVEVGVDNQWSKAGNSIEIKILPPWWQSYLAYLIYTLILFLILWLVAKYSINWISMKRRIALQEEREKQKEELIEFKTNFFTNISHEFKTPLTLINAAVSEFEIQNILLSGNRYFQVIKRNNSKLLHLISELMDFQRSNASLIELKTTYIDICKYLQEIYNEFLPLSEQKNIKLNLKLPSNAVMAWVDEECLTKIISNVISNSLRYTENGGVVNMELSVGQIDTYICKYTSKIRYTDAMQSGNQLIFSVSDTGVGISSESLPDIFKRFHTVVSKTSKHLGSGVGLALVKALVELHKGGVLINSERNVGTEFVFTIPLNEDYLKENQKVNESVFDRQLYVDDYKEHMADVQIKPLDILEEDDKPTLLIVDDNQEILMILSEHFKSEFNIYMALDGEEAFGICNKIYPDLVISDVMMPKMNGLELCSKIKSQFNTCLIPVILLTARGTTEQQIEGIEEGADAYIPKPFQLNLLHSTITNLLKKYKLTTQLSKPISSDIADDNLNIRNLVLDKNKQLFFDKITQIINDNIGNSNLSVDTLCIEIGVSRSRLYAQMKSISTVTIGEYIREIKYQKASELLRTTNLSIAEVAFRVGIDSPSFFTRWFKERFGMPPTEYIKKLNKSQEMID